jgi:hypothetical protein
VTARTLHEFRSSKSELLLPNKIEPGVHLFDRRAPRLEIRLAFDLYGNAYKVTEADADRLIQANELCLDFDSAAKFWRFVW